MSATIARKDRGLGHRSLRAMSFMLTLALAGGWFFEAAPTAVRGPATYVIVNGVSMQPMLHTGDLAVAHRRASYSRGQLVVFPVTDHGRTLLVIHRLVGGSAALGWKTKGDHNTWVDTWTVPNDALAGEYWYGIPAFGNLLNWTATHAGAFGSACTALALLLYIPWRRRKFAPVLRTSLSTAKKEPRPDGRSNQEYGVLWISGLATLAAIALVGLLGMSHQLVTVRGLIAVAALLWAGGFTVYFAYRLFDGLGVPEPSASLHALSGRLYLVEELPELDTPVQPVASAIALRTIAERYRMPVLHRVDPDSGAHEFLLITVQKGAFLWTVLPAPASHEPTTAPSAAPAVLQPAFAAACVAESLSSLGELLAPVPILATVEPVLEPAVDVDQPDIAPEKGDRRRAVRRTRWRERRRRTAHDRHHHDV